MVKILIKRNTSSILIFFDTKAEKFESSSERTKFFEELYGRDQVIKKDNKVYKYNREGLLDEIPNIRVANSAFIIMQENMRRMMEFFKEWEDKVEFDMFPVLLDQKRLRELNEEVEE